MNSTLQSQQQERLVHIPADGVSGEKQVVIIPGATHLFEEPGAVEEVSRLARQWFQHYLRPLDQSGFIVFQAGRQLMPGPS